MLHNAQKLFGSFALFASRSRSMSFPAETAHHHRAWTITTSFGLLLQHQRHQQQYQQQQQQQQQHLSLFKCYSSKTNSDAAAAGATNDTPKSSTVRKTYATGSIDSNGVVSIHNKSDGGSDGSGDGNNRRRRKHNGNSGGGGGRGGGGRRGQQQQRRPSRRRNNRYPPPPLLPSMSSGDPTNNDTRGCYRSVLLPGTEVNIIKKEHQRTSPQITTHGFIERSLGRSSYHPRGIKVVLQGSGAIGRVCTVFE